MKTTIIVVTGACGKLAYSLFGSILNGTLFGNDLIELRLVDILAKTD